VRNTAAKQLQPFRRKNAFSIQYSPRYGQHKNKQENTAKTSQRESEENENTTDRTTREKKKYTFVEFQIFD
jgi:hypothetical protein